MKLLTHPVNGYLDFIRPDSGSISLFNQPLQRSDTRKQIGYLPEIPNYPDNLSVNEMLDFTGQSCGIRADKLREDKKRWLDFFELWEVRNRPVKTYSKGMKQRASFATALINDPDLLILDEPMSGA
ncbi:MAG: ABC transporter ATP-binding protein [Desulfobacterales bacterium]|nr:ABC transporter ATP-binding protein [Desulfobacterales bacterium]